MKKTPGASFHKEAGPGLLAVAILNFACSCFHVCHLSPVCLPASTPSDSMASRCFMLMYFVELYNVVGHGLLSPYQRL